MISKLTLPNREHRPALSLKTVSGRLITLAVPIELGVPELRVGAGAGPPGAIMTMPEAPVHEDGGPKPRQDEIRGTRQVRCMKAKPVSSPMQKAPQL